MHHPSRDASVAAAKVPLFVFDFDGTVCLGAAPVLSYARAVERASRARGVVDALEAFLDNPRGDARFAHCDDPYDVVSLLATANGVDDRERSRAYRASRVDPASLDVHPPVGLHVFLESLSSPCVLVTNAPFDGLAAFLDRLELADAFADIVSDASKPDGMRQYATPHLATGRPVMSVGDKWVNDLAPVAELGGSTALIDTYGHAPAHRADHAARTLPELYPALQEWEIRQGYERDSTLAARR